MMVHYVFCSIFRSQAEQDSAPAASEKAQPNIEHEPSDTLEFSTSTTSLSRSQTPDDDQVKNDQEFEHIINQFDDQAHDNTEHAQSDSQQLPSRRRSSTEASNRNRRPSNRSEEIAEIPFDFNKFLEQMKRRGSIPITKYFKSFLQAFDRRPWTVNEQIKIIQDFLDFIYGKMRECDVWRDASEQEFENAKEGMEKLVMNRLFHYTFSSNTTDDKERDEILNHKIRIFSWITEEHLDIPVTQHNESFLTFAESGRLNSFLTIEVFILYSSASESSELLKINNYKAPRDKLICILNCCKVIFGLIRHVEGDAGADKFLPILIYVVLKSNPPKLVSNVQYINRFRNPDHLQSEGGYYLTNLMGAIAFIESLEAKSLSVTQEEFDNNIEKTLKEIEKERPVETVREKVNYDNAIHPSQSPRPGSSQSPPPLIDPVKASAFIEKGSNFAQKTMQKPLNFMGKILQNLNDSSRPSTPDSDEEYQDYQRNTGSTEYPGRQTFSPPSQSNAGGWAQIPANWDPTAQSTQHIQDYGQYRDHVYQQRQQQQPQTYADERQWQQRQYQQHPQYDHQVYQGNATQPPMGNQWVSSPDAHIPPRRQPPPQHVQQQHVAQQQHIAQQQQYQSNLNTLLPMFSNMDRDVIEMILQANQGDLPSTIDVLLDMSEPSNLAQEETTEVQQTELPHREGPVAEDNHEQQDVPAKSEENDEHVGSTSPSNIPNKDQTEEENLIQF
ncbi:hypothetical protein INT43_008177 [Umbelopsis isabellina]|uniref:Uncharacterized protein n=1 Tax=Mortierella isabellina TaxID=91625 RepID=A0A8H7PDB6_MORIS|nr:hypothetical protein INT43_008177 [Umbelopsis isabellina]